jgi:hypothetical protein
MLNAPGFDWRLGELERHPVALADGQNVPSQQQLLANQL